MKIKNYGKSELAMLYREDISPDAARHYLMDLITSHPELYPALQRSGYRDAQRFFTSYQVRLIVEYLGEP